MEKLNNTKDLFLLGKADQFLQEDPNQIIPEEQNQNTLVKAKTLRSSRKRPQALLKISM